MSTAHPPMKLRAMLPYFGGKRALAPAILDELAPDVYAVRQYFEPFHGSLAVLLELRDRGYARPAVVNDLHALASNLAECLSSERHGEQLLGKLSARLLHEDASRESAEACVDWMRRHHGRRPGYADFKAAAHYLAFSWMQRNGFAGTEDWTDKLGGFCVRFSASGGDPATRWRAMLDSIPGWWSRLQETTFTCRDGFDVIGDIPDEAGVLVYLDPPYLRATRKGGTYAHDFADGSGMLLESDDDHARLAALCARFERARVGVSYYDEPRVRELYPEADGWRVIDLARNKNLANATAGSTGGDAVEVLIVNDRRTEE